jgi:hypothetical protein
MKTRGNIVHRIRTNTRRHLGIDGCGSASKCPRFLATGSPSRLRRAQSEVVRSENNTDRRARFLWEVVAPGIPFRRTRGVLLGRVLIKCCGGDVRFWGAYIEQNQSLRGVITGTRGIDYRHKTREHPRDFGDSQTNKAICAELKMSITEAHVKLRAAGKRLRHVQGHPNG